ncbi:putative zinc-binding metallopeptidase [Mesorhizobium sp. RP14(2022)]|uniref:Zinc-binding metallopeptidase n=1 Tax=Mesorhizobium liriopis TaxID=2953882 RepID=A0ABT1C3S4_9HYPH|nr:putative zinc-binding metallopeptidase [Mesorhizobium liriopis]MCO6048860.1 putative zinc-binding metallopeptidase [Mesorhizobium liriopis]
MKLFSCPHCRNRIYFENTSCLFCGNAVLYLPLQRRFALPGRHGPFFCRNASECGCNWAAEEEGGFCRACQLNSTIPDLGVSGNRERWAKLEEAKRHLVYQLLGFGLDVRPKAHPDDEVGIAFDFLNDPPSDQGPRVLTGHEHGLITLNAGEADPLRREEMRIQMGESYRTLLGHFRHEIGHYYWDRLVRDDPAWLERSREVFGDERTDYMAALQTNYEQGPPQDWQERHISPYASSHPWEDFAETWAHTLHISDTLEMARALKLDPSELDAGVPLVVEGQGEADAADGVPDTSDDEAHKRFDAMLTDWLAVSEATNALNRCMGLPDVYPFVIAPKTGEKLRFVYELLEAKKRKAVLPAAA